MTNETSIFLEENKRLSESSLWRMQREYFDKEGINAWLDQVPFYVTSNPFIAHCYAQVVFNFICEWREKHPETQNDPFYILELGTGSGRFSFYVLKSLLHLLQKANMSELDLCYVMSDVTRNNINFYEQHHALLPYIEQGIIDFAIYNMEIEKPISLLNKKIQLDSKTLKNPLLVFANYIFDTISQDSFTIHDKKIYELLISLKTHESNLKNNRPVNLTLLKNDFQLNEIEGAYYPDPILNEILEEYKNSLHKTSILFPIGSIKALNYLSKLANGNLFVISTDKGYSNLQALDYLGPPSLSFHGSFSLMVNYHALSSYFKKTGGDCFLQTPRNSIKTSVFCRGLKLNELPHTSLAIDQYLENFSPGDYFTVHRRVSESFQECSLDFLAAHLQLTRWDPHMYLKLKEHLLNLVQDANPATLELMTANMPKLAANFYHLPHKECILFEVAAFFHAIKKYAEALRYYEQAENYIEDLFSVTYNSALCLQCLGKNEEALEKFKQALALDPNSSNAQTWINFLEKRKDNPTSTS